MAQEVTLLEQGSGGAFPVFEISRVVLHRAGLWIEVVVLGHGCDSCFLQNAAEVGTLIRDEPVHIEFMDAVYF